MVLQSPVLPRPHRCFQQAEEDVGGDGPHRENFCRGLLRGLWGFIKVSAEFMKGFYTKYIRVRSKSLGLSVLGLGLKCPESFG